LAAAISGIAGISLLADAPTAGVAQQGATAAQHPVPCDAEAVAALAKTANPKTTAEIYLDMLIPFWN
jgi:hypothetical protein